jgi:hypothetical protein
VTEQELKEIEQQLELIRQYGVNEPGGDIVGTFFSEDIPAITAALREAQERAERAEAVVRAACDVRRWFEPKECLDQEKIMLMWDDSPVVSLEQALEQYDQKQQAQEPVGTTDTAID